MAYAAFTAWMTIFAVVVLFVTNVFLWCAVNASWRVSHPRAWVFFWWWTDMSVHVARLWVVAVLVSFGLLAVHPPKPVARSENP